jgi:hypothetical protein
MTNIECQAILQQAIQMGVLSPLQADKRATTIKAMLSTKHYARHSGIRAILVNDLPTIKAAL